MESRPTRTGRRAWLPQCWPTPRADARRAPPSLTRAPPLATMKTAAPPDKGHAYGHGKAGSLAAVLAALGLLVAAGVIAWRSVHEILTPHLAPDWFTLPILIVAIITKELLFRFVLRVGGELESTAL